MANGFRSAASFAADVNGASATCTKPAGTVSGDVLIAVVSRSQTAAATTSFTSSGWSVAGFFPGSATYAPIAVLTKAAGGSEPANYTFTSNGFSGEDQFVIHIMALTGVDTATPIAVAPVALDAGSASANVVAPSITIPAGLPDQAWLVCAFTALWFGTASFGQATGMTERVDVGDVWLHIATNTQAVGAGATGTRTAVFSQSPSNAPRAISFAIRPATVTTAVTDPAPGSVTVSSPGGETVDAQPGTTTLTDAAPGSTVVSSPGGESLTLIPAVVVEVDAGDVVVEGLAPTVAHHVAVGVNDVVVESLTPGVAHHVHAGVGDVVIEVLPVEVAGQPGVGEIVVSGPPVQVAYGSTGAAGQGGVVAVPPQPSPRFLVQSILTGEWLSWDLELSDPLVTWVLSGPTAITGTLKPEDPETRKLLVSGKFQPWSCWIHLEVEGEILASGILQPYQIDGDVLSIEAAGPSAYPHGIPFQQELSGIQLDPADIIRAIWAHLQSFPDGKLGVTVVGSTPVRVGEPEHTEPKIDPETGQVELDDDGHPVFTVVAEKPYILAWWDGTDCGAEIDSLASQAPFDYVERCAWADDTHTSVKHWIEIGFPRIGRRHLDGGPRFATGENVYNVVPVEEADDLYASQVVVFGKGEGRSTLIGYAGRPMQQRLRRVALVQDKTIPSAERANARAGDELERRQGLVNVTELEVDAHHDNAEFGSYGVGDDVLIDVEVDWLGRLRQYERILSIGYDPNGESVRLELRRAEAFRYGEGA